MDDCTPDVNVISNEKTLRGLIEIAYIAMPDSHFHSDQRVIDACAIFGLTPGNYADKHLRETDEDEDDEDDDE